MTNIYTCWDILDEKGKQVAATDRPGTAEEMLKRGHGLLVHQTIVDVNGDQFLVLNSVTTYLAPPEKP